MHMGRWGRCAKHSTDPMLMLARWCPLRARWALGPIAFGAEKPFDTYWEGRGREKRIVGRLGVTARALQVATTGYVDIIVAVAVRNHHFGRVRKSDTAEITSVLLNTNR